MYTKDTNKTKYSISWKMHASGGGVVVTNEERNVRKDTSTVANMTVALKVIAFWCKK